MTKKRHPLDVPRYEALYKAFGPLYWYPFNITKRWSIVLIRSKRKANR